MDKQQIKSRFFGQHIGCKVRIVGALPCPDGDYALSGVSFCSRMSVELENVDCKVWAFDCKLILRPLSSITDEEVFEMFVFAGFFGIEIIRDNDKIGVIGRNGDCAVIWIKISPKPIGRFLEAWNNVENKEQPEVFEYMIVDWLRSKNFALPFCGIDPVEAGWAILEETTNLPKGTNQ